MAISEEALPYLNAFLAQGGNPAEPKSFGDRRDAAMRHFAELGFPTRKMEAWRFTDLRPLTAAPILPLTQQGGSVDEAALEPVALACPSHRLVLVDGKYTPELSAIGDLPPGVFLRSTAEALTTRPDLVEASFDASELDGRQSFASINAACFADGFVLALEPGAVLVAPVEIIHFTSVGAAGAVHSRSIVLAGAGSSATLIESNVGPGAAWSNLVTEISCGPDAVIRHVKVQSEAEKAFHTALIRATLQARARYEGFSLILGALLSRQDLQIALAGAGASVALNGAYLLRGDQEATIVPFVDHQAPGRRTDEIFKGVMQDRGHGVFLGAITVRPGADDTDANQLNRNLLLGPQARVDTKPELEIFADEVKCSHGATVGSLDEAALFYLQARGIDEATARHMLIEAFAADVIDSADLSDALSRHLRGYLQEWLEKARGP